ncbi:hypothetical protein F6476_14855 [Pseudomonas umsongensis]|nr:hypothetical protein F6476_14855 [Pseudomonas umsongensis]
MAAGKNDDGERGRVYWQTGWVWSDTARRPVGAGLLAIAVGQWTSMVPDTPLSPASRLLQRGCYFG